MGGSMARIPRAVIDEVRNSVDIVDVIGRYVQLKGRQTYRALSISQ